MHRFLSETAMCPGDNGRGFRCVSQFAAMVCRGERRVRGVARCPDERDGGIRPPLPLCDLDVTPRQHVTAPPISSDGNVLYLFEILVGMAGFEPTTP